METTESTDWLAAKAKQFYSEGKHEDASHFFTAAFGLAEVKPSSPERTTLLCGLLLNRSACLLKLKRHNEVVDDCKRVIELDETNERAYSRAVKSLLALTSFEPALNLAQLWVDKCPQSVDAKAEYSKLQIICDALMDNTDEDEELLDNAQSTLEISDKPRKEMVDSSNGSTSDNNAVSSLSRNGHQEENHVTDEDDRLQLSPLVQGDESLTCTLCSKHFHSTDELSHHCTTVAHQTALMSYDGREWKFRPPPHGLNSSEFSLCQSPSGHGCPFGVNCIDAHSSAELAEWRERFAYLQSRVEGAHKNSLYGSLLCDQIQMKLASGTASRESLLKQDLEGVNLYVNEDTEVSLYTKSSSFTWLITAACRDCLKGVTMLEDDTKSNFSILSVTTGRKKSQKHLEVEPDCTDWENPKFTTDRTANELVYRVKVEFQADVYGTFRQTVVFSYNRDTFLARELVVSVKAAEITDMTEELIVSESKRWESQPNIEIVKLEPGVEMDEDFNIKSKYSRPDAKLLTEDANILDSEFTAENYVHNYHTLLYYEEMEQYHGLAKFNITTRVTFVKKFLCSPTNVDAMQFSAQGELFARLALGERLSEDSLEGRILLMNVNSILLTTSMESVPNKVYETAILDKGKGFMMLRIPVAMVTECGIKDEDVLKCQAQFVVNRNLFCEMHAALDALHDVSILFPSSDHVTIPWSPSRQWSLEEKQLNAKQKEGLNAITSSSEVILPPILLSGPFGTGKTMTMAKTVLSLLKSTSNKILICTHSNSAADLYIEDYLHPYVESHPDADIGVVRLYYKHRWMSTVKDSVRKYCLYDSTEAAFRYPELKDIESAQVVVVTLSMCYSLLRLNLPAGFFTHILIDEAAQALETETLLPLALASRNTKIALAGDHMQMNPEVYSPLCRSHGLHHSLIERLFRRYSTDDHPCKIVLCENYRSHSVIVEFASELFYEGMLTSSGKQQAHPDHYPLTFLTARGEGTQHDNSTGYYNTPEVFETVDFIQDLFENWPTALWGKFDESSIGVVTPYLDQVIRLRSELRKKQLPKVSVERVFNVQGKQFRVIVINTVRSHHSRMVCDEKSSDFGFLSNPKLFNTAITRAQSLVAVIGDPMSVCSVGKCRAIWLKFMEQCHKNGSLHGVKWTQLQSYLDHADILKTYKLNPLAKEFIPRVQQVKQKTQHSPGYISAQSFPAPHLTQSFAFRSSIPAQIPMPGPGFNPGLYQHYLERTPPLGHPTPPPTAAVSPKLVPSASSSQFLDPAIIATGAPISRISGSPAAVLTGAQLNRTPGGLAGMPGIPAPAMPALTPPMPETPSVPVSTMAMNSSPMVYIAHPNTTVSPQQLQLLQQQQLQQQQLQQQQLHIAAQYTQVFHHPQYVNHPSMVPNIQPAASYAHPYINPLVQQHMMANQQALANQITAGRMAQTMIANQHATYMQSQTFGSRSVTPQKSVGSPNPSLSSPVNASPKLGNTDRNIPDIEKTRTTPAVKSAFKPPETFMRKNSFESRVPRESSGDPSLDPPWLRSSNKQTKKDEEKAPMQPADSATKHTPLYMRGSPNISPRTTPVRLRESPDERMSYSQIVKRPTVVPTTPTKPAHKLDMSAGHEFFNLSDSETSALDDCRPNARKASVGRSGEFTPGMLNRQASADSPLHQSQGSLNFSSHFPTRDLWPPQESQKEENSAPDDPLEVLRNLRIQSSYGFDLLAKGFGQGHRF